MGVCVRAYVCVCACVRLRALVIDLSVSSSNVELFRFQLLAETCFLSSCNFAVCLCLSVRSSVCFRIKQAMRHTRMQRDKEDIEDEEEGRARELTSKSSSRMADSSALTTVLRMTVAMSGVKGLFPSCRHTHKFH